MKKLILLISISISTSFAIANENTQEKMIKNHLHQYFLAFKNKNKHKLKSLVSSEYYSKLEKNNILANAFSKQVKRPMEDIDYKIIKAAKTKNRFFVNSKRKVEKNFDHYWYVVDLKNNKLLIHDMIFKEDLN
jgi:hypothetical protein